jgi:hypothetical protein
MQVITARQMYPLILDYTRWSIPRVCLDSTFLQFSCLKISERIDVINVVGTVAYLHTVEALQCMFNKL